MTIEKSAAISERKSRLEGVYPSAKVISSCEEWYESGLTENHLNEACIQVSSMIAGYNENHPNEMLEKSPETVRAQMEANRSIMTVHRENGHVEVMCHGTIYPAFESGEEDLLGMQVVEIGSLIVPEEYRKHGMGSLGNLLLLSLSDQFPNSVVLATVKQQNTAWAFDNADMEPANYWTEPYLSFLACSCSHCSEREGHSHCSFRRPPAESTTVKLSSILDRSQPPRKMDCTLVLNDSAQAESFEAKCREMHQQLLGNSISVVSPDTMREAMIEMRSFFEALTREAQKQNE